MIDLSNMLLRIKTIKKQAHLTNEDLAKSANIPKSTLDKMLAGIIKDPSIVSIIKIAKALNVSADYLLGLTNTPTPLETDANSSPFSQYDLLEMRAALKLLTDGLNKDVWGNYNKTLFEKTRGILINIGGIIDNYRAIAAAPKSTNFNKSLYHSIGVMTLDINADLGELIKLLQKASLEIQTTEENRQAIEKLIEIKRAKDKA